VEGLYGLAVHDEATETLAQYGYICLPFSGYNPESKRDVQPGIFLASLLPIIQWDFDYIEEKKQAGVLSVLLKMEGFFCFGMELTNADAEFWMFCPQYDLKLSRSASDVQIVTNLVSSVKATTNTIHSQVM
jgi:hypothetical protein